MNRRKFDSGWRDSRLPLVHADWGFDLPAPGMTFTMVEYDRGAAVGIINYCRRDQQLPRGRDAANAYQALAELRAPDGMTLPFFTCVYDPRNWAMQLFAHNAVAESLLGTRSWLPVTELHFGRLLYRLRGRVMPPLERYGVTFSEAEWTDADAPPAVRNGVMQPMSWPGQDMSARRRGYEPVGPNVRFSARNPCADIDFAVVGQRSGQVELFVDYKVDVAYIQPQHKTHQAMSGILDGRADVVPSFIAQYRHTGGGWAFDVWCLNDEARAMLRDLMIGTNAVADAWQPTDWTHVGEDRWVTLLDAARAR